MTTLVRRYKKLPRKKKKIYDYIKCILKTCTFLFWAFTYFIVMRLTIFKSDNSAEIITSYDDEFKENETVQDIWPENYVENVNMMEKIFANLTEDQYFSIEKEYEDRNRRIKETCSKYNLTQSDEINSKEFFISYRHNLVWCNIFKAASSSWMFNFNLLGGYKMKFLSETRQPPLKLARKIFQRPSVSELKKVLRNIRTFSFMIVREPFERLLSAYRDKLEGYGKKFYLKLSRNISKTYTKRKMKNNKYPGPTFKEFIKYITDNYMKNHERFKFDEHWAPYYKFCSPCNVNFTMIAKVETLQRDNYYIIKQLGLENLLHENIKRKKIRVKTIMNKSKDGKNTTLLLEKYFKQLDENLLKKLLEIYKIDFDMFGYDFNKYKKYVKK